MTSWLSFALLYTKSFSLCQASSSPPYLRSPPGRLWLCHHQIIEFPPNFNSCPAISLENFGYPLLFRTHCLSLLRSFSLLSLFVLVHSHPAVARFALLTFLFTRSPPCFACCELHNTFSCPKEEKECDSFDFFLLSASSSSISPRFFY